jgi:hypothetical protein
MCCCLLNCKCTKDVGESCQCAERNEGESDCVFSRVDKLVFGDGVYNFSSSFHGRWTSVSTLNLQEVRVIV